MVIFYLTAVGVCFTGRIMGEIKKLQPLRIICMLILLPLLVVAAYGLGQFSGSAHATIAISSAADRFLDAAIDQWDEGKSEVVRAEIRHLTDEIGETYERGHLVKSIDAATSRLTAK